MAPVQRRSKAAGQEENTNSSPTPSPKGDKAAASATSKEVKSSGKLWQRAGILLAVAVVLLAILYAKRLEREAGKAASSVPKQPPKKQPAAGLSEVWAPAREELTRPLQMNVTCSRKPGGDGTGATGLCGTPRRAGTCARFVIDNAISEDHTKHLRELLELLIDEAWGGGAGPPSVIDLHAETISYKERFVNLTELMKFKSLKFKPEHVAAYHAVRDSLREQLSKLFGVPAEGLQHDMTFFSHINASKTAKNLHDEYWHTHVDTAQYGTFAYTTLLYLATEHEDFNGGEFIFEDNSGGIAASVEPRMGRIVAFTSDAENPHRVLKVSSGIRLALTAAFTCSEEKAKSIEVFPKPALVEGSEGSEGSAESADA
eukprot:TRINITY_DN16838_c0_g1_i1.p1 TRINITY_DN16838_c0_g1~~TRINITY_DN16838_c0_g1_i1.p1  ORF type:complete len:394 (-),score=88.57 TRINITY_DN16838_c0_g1_i1:85-1200(-)